MKVRLNSSSCDYCGSKIEAEQLYCSSCGTKVPEPPPPLAEQPAPRAPEYVPGFGEPVQLPFRSQNACLIFELALVCAIAFGSYLFSSTTVLFSSSSPAASSRGELSWIRGIVHQSACLALLWYVLQRRAISFSA